MNTFLEALPRGLATLTTQPSRTPLHTPALPSQPESSPLIGVKNRCI